MPDDSSDNNEQNESDDDDLNLSDDDGAQSGDDLGETNLGKRGRKENGLVTLTLRFIALLKQAPN